MKGFITKDERPSEKTKRFAERYGRPGPLQPVINKDELCKNCGHMYRQHIFTRVCALINCACTSFDPSGQLYDWRK